MEILIIIINLYYIILEGYYYLNHFFINKIKRKKTITDRSKSKNKTPVNN